jgi:hypothetical protein
MTFSATLMGISAVEKSTKANPILDAELPDSLALSFFFNDDDHYMFQQVYSRTPR